MVTFTSTRGGASVSFTEALFRGLASDGGLYLPRGMERLDAAPSPADGSFARAALWAATRLLRGAVEGGALERIVTRALDFPVPLVPIEEGVYVLELFHGPSLAFKDVGARFMAQAMSELGDPGERPHTVLVATSGDTGSAVARAFHGLEGYRVVVLFPEAGISARQRRQMTTLGGNVMAVAVQGSFDDCQRLVKAAFADAELRRRHGLTSANSINVGRLLPQSFYYVHAAARLGWDGAPPTFVVPSGNLGNLTAGLLGHRLGMPAERFLAASNANRTFPDYLSSGTFRPRPSVPTVSNAMDVGDPSNFERIRVLYGDDLGRLADDVAGAWCSDDETRACIADVHARTGYVLDPHTAVAYRALQKWDGPRSGPAVVLATAHPAKFPEVVEAAIGRPLDVPEPLARALEGEEHAESMSPDLSALAELL
jgi:threonine synthase